MSKENLISVNLTRSKALSIKGLHAQRITDFTFGTSRAAKYLGFLVYSELSWSAHTKQQASKPLNALFFLERSPLATTLSNKKNDYISCLFPILNYGSSLWKLNESDLSVLESIHQNIVIRIHNTNSISYKDMLMKLGILPFCLYREVHVVLVIANTLDGKVDISWRTCENITDTVTTRNQITGNFSYTASRFKICDPNFWLRAYQLLSMSSKYFEMDILFNHQCKDMLLKLLQIYFKLNFNG